MTLQTQIFKVYLILIFSTIITAENPLDGKHLNVTTAHLYAVVDVVFDRNDVPILLSGTGYRYLEWLSQKLKFTYSFVNIHKEAVFGSLDNNGTWDGLIGELTRKEADLALSAFSLTHEWFEIVDVTFPWTEYDYSLFIPLPALEDKGWAALKPFQYQVWLCIVATLVVITLLLWTASANTNGDGKGDKSVGTPLMYLTSIITSQGSYLNMRGRAVTILAATWCFGSLIFINTYNGMLVSFLSTTRYSFLVTSLQDLVSKPTTNFYTFKDTYPDLYFMIATSGDYKPLGDSLRRRPDSRLLALEDCMKKPVEGDNICVMVTKPGDSFLADLSSSLRKCPFTRTRDTFMLEYNVFALPKNSPYTNALSKEILWAKAFGLDRGWLSPSSEKPNPCLNIGDKKVESVRLTLSSVKSIFFILCVGYLFSFSAFTVEFFTKFLPSSKRRCFLGCLFG